MKPTSQGVRCECDAMWRGYAHFTAEHGSLMMKRQMATADRDENREAELEPLVLQAEARRVRSASSSALRGCGPRAASGREPYRAECYRASGKRIVHGNYGAGRFTGCAERFRGAACGLTRSRPLRTPVQMAGKEFEFDEVSNSARRSGIPAFLARGYLVNQAAVHIGRSMVPQRSSLGRGIASLCAVLNGYPFDWPFAGRVLHRLLRGSAGGSTPPPGVQQGYRYSEGYRSENEPGRTEDTDSAHDREKRDECV